MFYFMFVFFIVTLFNIKNIKSLHSKYLIMVLASYSVAIFALMFYLAKDSYYYNIVRNYFSLPKSIWKFLMFAQIERFHIIRLLNLSSLGVIYFSICFTLSFRDPINYHANKKIKNVARVFIALQLMIYEPLFYIKAYNFLYPDYLMPADILNYQTVIHSITTAINLSLLAASIIILIHAYFNVPPIRLVKLNILGITVCYTLITLSYFFILWFSPTFLIKVSKFAGTHTYISISLNKNVVFYHLFPYYLIISFLLITYSVYKISVIRKRIDTDDFTISKQIDASETTSKVFCHYIKNELLAIQSEIEMIEIAPENQQSIQSVLNRCENLYNRLDSIHRSTKTSELSLAEGKIKDILQKTLDGLSFELKDYHVTMHMPEYDLVALVDVNYFEQALHNIFNNAIDAMKELEPSRKKLMVTVKTMDNWIVLMIEDTGIGITKNNLNKIFTPFFSSQPIAKHWGIGLSLTHKIIMAHEGKIEVDSEPDKGTIVKIMLPNVKKILF